MIIARHKLRLIIATLLIIIAVVAWTKIDNQSHNANSLQISTESDIDFFVENAELKTFDINGQLSQLALSTKIEHYRQKMFSSAQKMQVSSYQTQLLNADISSNRARIYDNQGRVIFRGNVEVNSYKIGQKQAVLKTQTLTYHRDMQTITTEDFVEFTDIFGNITTAVGLSADLQLKTAILKNNVQGTFNEN